MLDSSVAVYQRDTKLNGGLPPSGLAVTYARAGRVNDARAVIKLLEAEYAKRYYPPDLNALAYASIGELDHAFEWMQRVFEKRSSAWIGFGGLPDWEPLRRDPRWAQMRKRAGLN